MIFFICIIILNIIVKLIIFPGKFIQDTYEPLIYYNTKFFKNFILINKYKNPENTDKIFIYFPGNGEKINNLKKYNKIVEYLLNNRYTVCIYQYPEDNISENIIYNQGIKIYNELIDNNFKNISFFGFSLGCSVCLNLLKNLNDNNKELPKKIFLQSPFSSIKNIISNYISIFSYFIYYDFNNYKKLKEIYLNNKNNIEINIFISNNDKIVPNKDSLKLKEYCHNFIILEGDHNNFNIDKYDKYIN